MSKDVAPQLPASVLPPDVPGPLPPVGAPGATPLLLDASGALMLLLPESEGVGLGPSGPEPEAPTKSSGPIGAHSPAFSSPDAAKNSSRGTLKSPAFFFIEVYSSGILFC